VVPPKGTREGAQVMFDAEDDDEDDREPWEEYKDELRPLLQQLGDAIKDIYMHFFRNTDDSCTFEYFKKVHLDIAEIHMDRLHGKYADIVENFRKTRKDKAK
jgi:hypothetical protein